MNVPPDLGGNRHSHLLALLLVGERGVPVFPDIHLNQGIRYLDINGRPAPKALDAYPIYDKSVFPVKVHAGIVPPLFLGYDIHQNASGIDSVFLNVSDLNNRRLPVQNLSHGQLVHRLGVDIKSLGCDVVDEVRHVPESIR